MTTRSYDHEGRLLDGEHSGVVHTHGPATEESLQQLLHRTESELSSHFPMMVDSVTRLDAVKAGDAALHYHYTLLNASVDELDVDATRAALSPLVQQQVQGMEFLKLLITKGATIAFQYADKDGKEITVIEVRAGQA
jgi:hypothetical protein